MSRTSGTRDDCASRLDATAEAELDVIVAVYCFILFGRNTSKKAAVIDGSDDAEDLDNERTDTNVVPE
jgi:hypothetical protein